MDSPGVMYRVAKGVATDPMQFYSLTDCPQDRTCFFFGDDGFTHVQHLSPYDMLLQLGFHRHYIQEKVSSGYRFELLTLDTRRNAGFVCERATWDGVRTVCEAAYPELSIGDGLWARVRALSLEDHERAARYRFDEARRQGSAHPGYMTLERTISALVDGGGAGTGATTAEIGTDCTAGGVAERCCALGEKGRGAAVVAAEGSEHAAWVVRAFLFHTMGLRGLYRGDGYTWTHDNRRGIAEYLCRNCPRSQLSLGVSPLSIDIPKGDAESE
eukprot:TRINITY_DN9936_c0_g1_i1.p1 TRINITY_DN9936_c0_g1~~TRINITY_DN9936_c0_g1_i1.p1  ORF type:complete len:271 (+),score=52.00 TRINITY_DN9936_c0_g1_i1:114-926(+)